MKYTSLLLLLLCGMGITTGCTPTDLFIADGPVAPMQGVSMAPMGGPPPQVSSTPAVPMTIRYEPYTEASMEEALVDRTVLLYFTTENCVSCATLESILRGMHAAGFSGPQVFFRVDLWEEVALREQYLVEVPGTMVAVDWRGEQVARKVGMTTMDALMDFLDSL